MVATLSSTFGVVMGFETLETWEQQYLRYDRM